MIIATQMLIFLLIITVGMSIKKLGMIDQTGQKQLSRLVVNVSSPCMIIAGALGTEPGCVTPDDAVVGLSLGIGLYGLLILCGELCPSLFGFKGDERPVAKLIFTFTNIVFIGMPLISAVYDSRALIYLSLFFLPSNVLYYTYALLTISGKHDGLVKTLKKLVNPGTVASIIAIVVFFGEIPVPYVLSESVQMIGRTTGPMAMLLIGASLLDLSIRDFIDLRMLIFVLVRFMIFPIPVLLALKLFIDDEALLGTALVLLAAPVGNLIAMFAMLHNPNAYPVACKAIALSTVLCVLTLPVVSLVSGV